MSAALPVRARLPLLGMGAVALIAAMGFGLSRLGALPAVSPTLLLAHGPLMVCGFLGTVIALERAVASGRRWAFLAPLACAVGTLLLLVGVPLAGSWAWLLGSVAVVAILLSVVRGDPALHHLVLLGAAVAWAAGNARIVLGAPIFDAVPLWVVFLIGTICAERLELNRLLPRTRVTRGTFVFAAALLALGGAVGFFSRELGMRLLGAGAMGLSVWLWRFDIARRTLRQKGAVRFIASSLLCGYAGLGVGGVLALIWGHPIAGPRWDAMLHAWFVGFVFSMIFGHALVIVPAVLAVRVDFRQRFYAHLILLHASLVLRVTGDLIGSAALRKVGACSNVAAILVFLVSTALATRKVRATAHGGVAVASAQ